METNGKTASGGNGFDHYRRAAESMTRDTPEQLVALLQELSAEIDACAGAARMIAQGVAGGTDPIDLAGSAEVLAGRLNSLVTDLGEISEAKAGGDA